MTEDFTKLTGIDLVRAYNRMAESQTGKELGRFKPVQSFVDDATGVKMCEAIAGSIKARESGLKGEDKMTTKTNGKRKPAKAKKAKAVKKTAKAKTAKVKKPKVERTGIAAELGIRADGAREKLITFLGDNKGKTFPVGVLAKRVGVDNKTVSAFVWRFEKKIAKRKAKYKIVRNEGEKGTEYGLSPK